MKLIYIADNHDYEVLDKVMNEYGITDNDGYIEVEDDKAEEVKARLLSEGFKKVHISKMSTRDFIDAVATSNADPFLVENDEEALELLHQAEDFGMEEIDKSDADKWEHAVAILDLDKQEVDAIYRCGDFTVCFEADHNWTNK